MRIISRIEPDRPIENHSLFVISVQDIVRDVSGEIVPVGNVSFPFPDFRSLKSFRISKENPRTFLVLQLTKRVLHVLDLSTDIEIKYKLFTLYNARERFQYFVDGEEVKFVGRSQVEHRTQ